MSLHVTNMLGTAKHAEFCKRERYPFHLTKISTFPPLPFLADTNGSVSAEEHTVGEGRRA